MQNISLSAAVFIPSPKARDYIEKAENFQKTFTVSPVARDCGSRVPIYRSEQRPKTLENVRLDI